MNFRYVGRSVAALALGACAAFAEGAAAATEQTAPVIVSIPHPTGSARVGTTSFDLDTVRPEPMTDSPADTRRIVVQLWYPAEPGECKAAPYMDAETSRAVAEELPADFGLHVRHDACLDAAPASTPSGRFPVLLFSHGLGATRFSNSALLEELASRGYVVAAIHHTFGSQITVFVDGSIVPWDETKWDAPDAIESNLAVWVDDAKATLDRLAVLDRESTFRLHGRLALERVGYAGHSFGGATAVLARSKELRIVAVADLDGRLPPSLARPIRLDVPFLVLLSEPSQRSGDFAPAPDLYLARIAGTSHTSFTDSAFVARSFAPAEAVDSKLADPRPMTPESALDLTRRAVVAFFDCSLRGEAARCGELRATFAAVAMN